MTLTSHDHNEPLHTDDQIYRRATDLIGCAIREQLWVLFLDDDALQLPILMPVEKMPRRATRAGCNQFATSFAELAREIGAASVVLVRERLGDADVTARDSEWAEHLTASFAEAGLPIRALLLSSEAGVAPLAAA